MCLVGNFLYKNKNALTFVRANGDPDENRTRVTAVKGRCLSRLTTGPYKLIGSDRWIRTIDTSGMNRML